MAGLPDKAGAPPTQSPTLTATSLSSYGMPSPDATTSWTRKLSISSFGNLSDDDEIVWGLASSNADVDDDDFVVINRRSHPSVVVESGVATPVEDRAVAGRAVQLQSQLQGLSLEENRDAQPAEEPVASPTISEPEGTRVLTSNDDSQSGNLTQHADGSHDVANVVTIPKATTKQEEKSPREAAPSLSAAVPLPIVKKEKDSKRKASSKDASKAAVEGTVTKKAKKSKRRKASRKASKKAPAVVTAAAPRDVKIDDAMFEEASTYITSFLSSPEAKDNSVCRLTLLQSLIVELGLIPSSLNLPATLTSAKQFLKSKAFLNIKEYISVRDQGQLAIRNLLYPSRSALVKDIRKKRNAASLQWVKDHGLQVLLVGAFYH